MKESNFLFVFFSRGNDTIRDNIQQFDNFLRRSILFGSFFKRTILQTNKTETIQEDFLEFQKKALPCIGKYKNLSDQKHQCIINVYADEVVFLMI